MKHFSRVVLFLVVSTLCLAQQSVEGIWLGGLTVGDMTLRLAFHISKTDKGYVATMDSLDQGAKDVPVTSVTVDGKSVDILMKPIRGEFTGRLSDDGNVIDGNWIQGGAIFPLQLKRSSAAALEVRRPQNPTRPYPYKEEEVTFPNRPAGILLAGTLTLPQTKGPFPTVLLITGSGPQNRDEEILGHRPFLVISDYLTRRGFAVLRVDDRGVGRSQGKFSEATTADFATDTEAALVYLLTRPEVDLKHLGLLGHSEGGTIAAMVAARNPGVAFVVMLAGAGVPGDKIIPEQAKMMALVTGATADAAEQQAQQEREAIALVETEKDPVTLQNKLREKLAGWVPPDRINGEITVLTSPWYRYFLTYDPATALRKVKCPVLALNGSLDHQINPEQNLPAIRKALKEAANTRVDIEEVPGLNHLFQTANTGSVSEYSQIEETISPAVLEKIAKWLDANTSVAPAPNRVVSGKNK